MRRGHAIGSLLVSAVLLATLPAVFAQQPAPGRGAQPPGTGQPAGRGGRGGENTPRPAILFREEWKAPTATPATDETRRVTQDAVSSPGLELKLYGAEVHNVGVYQHEGRNDLWTGLANSPVAITLRDKSNYVDLTGLARVRWMVRTASLHSVHPVVRLADGTLLVGNNAVSTDGQFITTEVAFGPLRWFKLDPQKVVTTTEVKNADLSKVDEVGFADLMPSGGHGAAGYLNVSTVELFAKSVPR